MWKIGENWHRAYGNSLYNLCKSKAILKSKAYLKEAKGIEAI